MGLCLQRGIPEVRGADHSSPRVVARIHEQMAEMGRSGSWQRSAVQKVLSELLSLWLCDWPLLCLDGTHAGILISWQGLRAAALLIQMMLRRRQWEQENRREIRQRLCVCCHSDGRRTLICSIWWHQLEWVTFTNTFQPNSMVLDVFW